VVWEAPRTWVTGEVPTSTLFNSQFRDNFLAVDQHAHSGVAGDGGTTLGALVKATLTDAAAPAAPGAGKTALYAVSGRPHYRAGAGGADTELAATTDTHATRHEPLGADVMAVDAVAATGSLRTLGSGAQQAAVGDHTHVPASEATGLDEDNLQHIEPADNAEYTIATLSATPGATGRAWVMFGTFVNKGSSDGNTYTLKLKFDSTVVHTRTGISGGADAFHGEYGLAGFQASPSVASHTVSLTFQKTAGSSAADLGGLVGFREVSC